MSLRLGKNLPPRHQRPDRQGPQSIFFQKPKNVQLVSPGPPFPQLISCFPLEKLPLPKPLFQSVRHHGRPYPAQQIIEAVEFRDQIEKMGFGLVVKAGATRHGVGVGLAVGQIAAGKHLVFRDEFGRVPAEGGQVPDVPVMIQGRSRLLVASQKFFQKGPGQNGVLEQKGNSSRLSSLMLSNRLISARGRLNRRPAKGPGRRRSIGN